MKRLTLIALTALVIFLNIEIVPADDKPDAADVIIHHAKVLTVDEKFTIAEALAIRGDRLVFVGEDEDVFKFKGPKTVVIDAHGRDVLPGLYDSHLHPVGAATSELSEPLPALKSLGDVFAHIEKKTKELPEGSWIVLPYAFPTRLKEARFPTKAELDKVAPNHPVLYNAGPASMVNSKALEVSGITKDTPNPTNGVIVKDPATGELTGMMRNAEGKLKVVRPQSKKTSPEDRLNALKTLFALYNSYGITSGADRRSSPTNFQMYHQLLDKGELTIRLNVAPGFDPYGTQEEIAKRFDNLPGKDGKFGPTGKGGVWIRIGPIKFFMDGGMLNGTAYMRQPWPPGPTYQIVENDYRGLLFVKPERAKIVVEEAAKRKWSVTAHCAGEGAMDVLLDAYEFVNRSIPIKDLRFCITHANFPSAENLKRCKELGVFADVQPAWLYKDGTTLNKVLGKDRIRWFQPYKSWMEHTVIGGGSDHMVKIDPIQSTNPWQPWLAMEVAITRRLESGLVLNPSEAITREQALRLYTINNAIIHGEQKEKGSLEVGKLADLIMIDRDYMTCPERSIHDIRVMMTMVGGKVVYERKE